MLDERKLHAALLRAQGIEISEIARTVGCSRQAFYDWLKNEEFNAEVDRCRQEFLTVTRNMLAGYGPKAVQNLINLAKDASSEKVKLDATGKILDKLVSNATKIEIDDNRDSDIVSIDILEEEMKEFDNE